MHCCDDCLPLAPLSVLLTGLPSSAFPPTNFCCSPCCSFHCCCPAADNPRSPLYPWYSCSYHNPLKSTCPPAAAPHSELLLLLLQALEGWQLHLVMLCLTYPVTAALAAAAAVANLSITFPPDAAAAYSPSRLLGSSGSAARTTSRCCSTLSRTSTLSLLRLPFLM